MTLRTATRRAFLYPAASAAASDWWLSGGISAANAIAVYQPIGAASLAASYTDLTGNGNTASVVSVAPTWDATNGWKRIAGSGDLDSGVIITNSSWSAIVRFSDYSGDAFEYIGTANPSAGQNYCIGLREGGANHSYYNHEKLVIETALSNGVIGLAGQEGFLNGSSEGTTSSSWSGGSLSFYLLTMNAIGTPGQYYPDNLYVQAVAIYDTTLTSDQVAAVSTAMAAL